MSQLLRNVMNRFWTALQQLKDVSLNFTEGMRFIMGRIMGRMMGLMMGRIMGLIMGRMGRMMGLIMGRMMDLIMGLHLRMNGQPDEKIGSLSIGLEDRRRRGVLLHGVPNCWNSCSPALCQLQFLQEFSNTPVAITARNNLSAVQGVDTD